MSKFWEILIVDDCEFDRVLLTQALTKKGSFKITQASGSEECLRDLDRRKPDLILMDIVMPGTEGTEVLKEIRKRFNAIELPVIMTTSKTDYADIVGALQSGANDYITKPVHFDVALSRIMTHLLLADSSREMSLLKEKDAINAMIATYNHEINNPLAIAIGCLNQSDWKSNPEKIDKLENALWRIAEIVKKIQDTSSNPEVVLERYSGRTKILKVR